MANNRLFIVDSITGERFLLCKSFGHGWQSFQRALRAAGATEWVDETAEEWVKRLDAWLALRDTGAAYGNTNSEPSELRLVTENEMPAEGSTTKAEGV